LGAVANHRSREVHVDTKDKIMRTNGATVLLFLACVGVAILLIPDGFESINGFYTGTRVSFHTLATNAGIPNSSPPFRSGLRIPALWLVFLYLGGSLWIRLFSGRK
jgi:hypothetical protein